MRETGLASARTNSWQLGGRRLRHVCRACRGSAFRGGVDFIAYALFDFLQFLAADIALCRQIFFIQTDRIAFAPVRKELG